MIFSLYALLNTFKAYLNVILTNICEVDIIILSIQIT